MLADALPDRFGNQLIDTWLAVTGKSPVTFNPVNRLCYIGRRGMPSSSNSASETDENEETGSCPTRRAGEPGTRRTRKGDSTEKAMQSP